MYDRHSSLVDTVAVDADRWDAALRVKGTAGYRDIVTLYGTLARVAGLDGNLALAQACDECDWFRSPRWTENHNPAGIGITGDRVAGVDFGTAERGIKAHLALVCCHAMAETPAAVRAWGVLESFGYGGFQRGAPVLADLEGHWAVPGDGYADAIAAIANQVVGADPPPAPAGIPGAAVVAAAMTHIGDVRQWDTWNGWHQVSMMCQADVEDWLVEAGVPDVAHYVSAAAAGDAGALNDGPAPAGAQCFWRGGAWSPFDHTGISLGDGRTISGLASVIISPGWQELISYRGWRFAPGVVADSVPAPVARFAQGNPYGAVPLVHPFWSRYDALDRLGLALPMMGWPVAPEVKTAQGRRVQRFERGWYGVQPAPAPWDLVQLLPTEVPT